MRRIACLSFLGLLSLSCSWSRYDEVVKDSPIVLLSRPKELSSGFGTSLATGSVKDDVTLLVGGSPLKSGGAEFALQTAASDAPSLQARDTGHCLGGDFPCYFSSSPVALQGAKGPGSERPLCFVDGAGKVGDEEIGLVVRCLDDVEYALPIPDGPLKQLEFSMKAKQATPFRLGADTGQGTALLASADEDTAVWYYPPLDDRFIEIPSPADSKGRWTKDAPRTLAVARLEGEARRLLAVGEAGNVRLFVIEGSAEPSYVGCLGGPAGFGRSFATGPVVAGDEEDELVIADASRVYVFDAAKLATLPPTANADCSLSALPAGSLVTSFTCGSTKNISGCGNSEFGAALAVGDLDGDGDGEVVVGAPNMTVRHVNGAGALIIYDVEEETQGVIKRQLYDFLDIAFLSSAAEGDQLGRSIALPDLGDHQLLVAGAPGGGKAALFYCPSFLPSKLDRGRCQ